MQCCGRSHFPRELLCQVHTPHAPALIPPQFQHWPSPWSPGWTCFLPILASARVRREFCRTLLTLLWLPLAFAGWSSSPNCAILVVAGAIEHKATTLRKCLCVSPTCPSMGFATVRLLCEVLTHCGVPHCSFGHFTCCLVPRGLLCVPIGLVLSNTSSMASHAKGQCSACCQLGFSLQE